MLPILGLFGLALAASLWPDSDADGDREPQTAGGDLSASSTSATESNNGDSPLSYASSSSHDTTDTLSDADAAPADSDNDTLTGTDHQDVLFGFDGDDTLTGGAGADVLNGGAGDDWLFGADDSEGDDLIGGDDHDDIWLGDDDRATGGSGDDKFHMVTDGTAFISDYNPDDDLLMVYYDPAGPVPSLSTETTDDGIRLLADDTVIAILTGAKVLDLDKVQLLSEAA